MVMEKFYGYRCVVKDGLWSDKTANILRTQEDIQRFLLESILDHYEIRITDDNDCLCFHVVDKELLFPKPPGEENRRNKWDPIIGKFVPEGVARPETEGEKFARRNGLIR